MSKHLYVAFGRHVYLAHQNVYTVAAHDRRFSITLPSKSE